MRLLSSFAITLAGSAVFCGAFNSGAVHSQLNPHGIQGRISASTLRKLFTAVMRWCDVESFLNIGCLYQEIALMEKRLNMHIELLRRDEFRKMESLSDIVKCVSPRLGIACRLLIDLIENLGSAHPAETYFSGFDYDLGERALGYLTSFDLDLNIFAASIGMTKTSIKTFVQGHETVLDLGGYSINTELFEPLRRLLDQYKGAKVLSKPRQYFSLISGNAGTYFILLNEILHVVTPSSTPAVLPEELIKAILSGHSQNTTNDDN
ncbi:dynein associated protein-domain-containing protein [Mycena leptocephala]|nr:dynein associated protein-domain-containing protein [Mycena leptocephala]